MSTNVVDGLQIVTVPYFKREVVGIEVHRVPAHKLFFWLARWLPIRCYVEVERRVFRYANPVIDDERGIIYCAPEQYEIVRSALVQTSEHAAPGRCLSHRVSTSTAGSVLT
jgi:hypothetical protein